MRWLTIQFCVFFCLLLAACTPAAAPITMTPTGMAQSLMTAQPVNPAQTTPNAVPTAETIKNPTAAIPVTASRFDFVDGNPVLSGEHDWDKVYIDPGAVVYHGGSFHMFYNGIDGFPRSVGVGYAISTDGIHWKPQVDQPLFHASDLFPNDPKIKNLFVTSGLIQANGTWVLYFYTLESSDFIHAQSIGRATAPSPTGPWKADQQMILSPGPENAWDDLQVSGPKVLQTPSGYVMYYDGMNQSGTSMIGRAVSLDGIHWTKYNDPTTTEASFAESDPVLKPDPSSWDQKRVIDPNILLTANGWQIIYLSTSCVKKFGNCEYGLGQATSGDGIHWKKSPGNPILSSKDHPDWRATYLVSLVQQADKLLLYMDFSGAQFSGTRVFLAVPKGQGIK